jgi:hypothetical protein
METITSMHVLILSHWIKLDLLHYVALEKFTFLEIEYLNKNALFINVSLHFLIL